MEFGQLHHVEYFVNDLKRSNEFWNWFMPAMGYVKSNEWQVGISWSHANGTYLVFVEVQQQFRAAKNNRQGNGLNHIAFTGKTISHLNELQRELEHRKIKILKRKDDYLCFEDPNDFPVEVYATAKQE